MHRWVGNSSFLMLRTIDYILFERTNSRGTCPFRKRLMAISLYFKFYATWKENENCILVSAIEPSSATPLR